MAPVQAPKRSRDATDEPAGRTPVRQVIDESRHAQLVARAEALVTQQKGHSALANRALASYAQIADSTERNSLQNLLGFDDYA